MSHSPALPIPSPKKIGVIALAAIIFFTISGGPFGLEPLIGYAGQWSLPLLFVVPLLWDIPSILMVLELNSLLPQEGGYYQWVKQGLGIRWAFYEGWWTWLYTFVDLAIYPVLFVEYISYFFPSLAAWKIPICLVVIWANAFLNIRGIVLIGRASLLLGIFVITPFFLMAILSFGHPAAAIIPAHSPVMNFHALGLALFTIMWNYIGWDNATTYANEIKKPARSYVSSIAIAFIAVYMLYILSVYAVQYAGIDVAVLSQNGFPDAGLKIGGPWLGALLSAAGMASMLGIFAAVLLSVSRIPTVMAEDKLLPKLLAVHHRRFNTPYVSIILCALVTSFMILFSFEELLVIDISLYAAGIALEFISLIMLRRKSGGEFRAFKIPFNGPLLLLLCLLPFLVFFTALAGVMSDGAGGKALLFTGIALISAHPAWLLAKRKLLSPR